VVMDRWTGSLHLTLFYLKRSNCRYNGSHVNIYTNAMQKHFKFKNLFYNKVLVFYFLIKFYIEELLSRMHFGVQIIHIMFPV
jgi:hypothetical protein